MNRMAVVMYASMSLIACSLVACSSEVDVGRRCSRSNVGCTSSVTSGGGTEGAAARGGSTGDTGGNGGAGAIPGSVNALTVHVEDADKMTVEIVTLACAGDCVDLEAVAHGGHAPYTFAWEDGSTNATRHVCLDASTKLAVSATDTAIGDAEFYYDAQTARATVSANVLDCPDGGGSQDAAVPGDCIDTEPGAWTGLPQPAWQVCGPAPQLMPRPDGTAPAQCSEINPTLAARVVAYDDAPADQEYSTGRLCTPLGAGSMRGFWARMVSSFGSGEVGDLTPFGPVGTGLGGHAVHWELWGGDANCDKQELLWTSEVNPWADQQFKCATLQPKQRHTHVTMVWHLDADPGHYRLACFAPKLDDPSSCAP